MKKHGVAKDLLAFLPLLLHENNRTIIPTDSVTNSILSVFFFSETKNKNKVKEIWWSGKDKYF